MVPETPKHLFYAVLRSVRKGANCFNPSVLGLVGGLLDPVGTMAPFSGTACAVNPHVFTDEKAPTPAVPL